MLAFNAHAALAYNTQRVGGEENTDANMQHSHIGVPPLDTRAVASDPNHQLMLKLRTYSAERSVDVYRLLHEAGGKNTSSGDGTIRGSSSAQPLQMLSTRPNCLLMRSKIWQTRMGRGQSAQELAVWKWPGSHSFAILCACRHRRVRLAIAQLHPRSHRRSRKKRPAVLVEVCGAPGAGCRRSAIFALRARAKAQVGPQS